MAGSVLMILYIDSSDPEKVSLKLKGQKNFEHHFFSQRLSEELVPEIKKFLKKSKVTFQMLKKIEVHSGPGHFSRIRSAVAVANALSFALDLPQKLVQPHYDRPPHITKPRL